MSWLASGLGAAFGNPLVQWGLNQQSQNAYNQNFDRAQLWNTQGYNQGVGMLNNLYGQTMGMPGQMPFSPATNWVNQQAAQAQNQQGSFLSRLPWFGALSGGGNQQQQGGGGGNAPTVPPPPSGGGQIYGQAPWDQMGMSLSEWQNAGSPSPGQQQGVGSQQMGPGYASVPELAQSAQNYYAGAGQRYNQAMQPITSGWNRLGGQLGQQSQDILGLAGQRAQQGMAGYGNLASGYGSLRNTAMNMLEGAGAQERTDINRRFDQQQAGAMADLVNRGLRGSSLAAGATATNERARSDALGGLNERLLQQRLGTYTGLTGQGLAAQERGLGFGAGLTGDQMNAMANQQGVLGQYGQNRLNAMQNIGAGGLGYMDAARAASMQAGLMPHQWNMDLTGQQLNWMQGAQYPYPQQPQMMTYQYGG